MPEEDPLLGDKTPAIVEWYQKYDPEEFERRYVKRHRKTHLRKMSRPRSEDLDYDDEGRAMKKFIISSEPGLIAEPRQY